MDISRNKLAYIFNISNKISENQQKSMPLDL